jgi:predicted transcriptional regulator
MEYRKKIVFGMLVLTIFVLIVAISSLYVQVQIEADNVCGCLIPLNLFIPLLASIGLFIGTLAYYLFSPRFDIKKPDMEPVLSMLDRPEADVIRALISSKGEMSQARIGKVTNMSKVKVFRTIDSLKRKGIVEKSAFGKTNIIRLTERISKIFL